MSVLSVPRCRYSSSLRRQYYYYLVRVRWAGAYVPTHRFLRKSPLTESALGVLKKVVGLVAQVAAALPR